MSKRCEGCGVPDPKAKCEYCGRRRPIGTFDRDAQMHALNNAAYLQNMVHAQQNCTRSYLGCLGPTLGTSWGNIFGPGWR